MFPSLATSPRSSHLAVAGVALRKPRFNGSLLLTSLAPATAQPTSETDPACPGFGHITHGSLFLLFTPRPSFFCRFLCLGASASSSRGVVSHAVLDALPFCKVSPFFSDLSPEERMMAHNLLNLGDLAFRRVPEKA